MRRARFLPALLLIISLTSGAMWADSIITQDGFTFTTSQSGTYQFTLTALNNSGLSGYFQGFGWKDLFASGTVQTASIVSAPTGTSATINVGFENGSGECKGSVPNAICVDIDNLVFGNTEELKFVIEVGGSGLTLNTDDLWHLQTYVSSNRCTGTDPANPCAGPGTLTRVSRSSRIVTPEPATVGLFGIGLAALGGIIRRKRK